MMMLWSMMFAACEPDKPPPNGIIIISVDTLRADRVGYLGGAADLMPNLNALAETSFRFHDAHAAANETLFSHGALFTGQMPSAIAPINYDFSFQDDQTTLASAARDAGWKTAAVVASGHLSRVFGLDVGFDDYVESRQWGSFFQTVPLATQWLDRHLSTADPASFLLFVHSYDCHSPYSKPGPMGRLASPQYHGLMLGINQDPLMIEKLYIDRYIPSAQLTRIENNRQQPVLSPNLYAQLRERAAAGEGSTLQQADFDYLVGQYETAIQYADMQIGVFLEALEARGLLDTTTLVVLSDHGEGLMTHDFFSHRSTLRDAEVHVPLLIRPPGGLPSGRDVYATTSLIDVAPTLLEASAIPVPDVMTGRDLTGCFQDRCPEDGVAISEAALDIVSITDGAHRLVVTDGQPSLYDDHDQPVDDPIVRDALLAQLQERLR